jgi:hypothetical protein
MNQNCEGDNNVHGEDQVTNPWDAKVATESEQPKPDCEWASEEKQINKMHGGAEMGLPQLTHSEEMQQHSMACAPGMFFSPIDVDSQNRGGRYVYPHHQTLHSAYATSGKFLKQSWSSSGLFRGVESVGLT